MPICLTIEKYNKTQPVARADRSPLGRSGSAFSCVIYEKENIVKEFVETLIPDIPESFRKEIHEHIRLFSVSMLLAEDDQTDIVIPSSGTLCSYKTSFGILTARHVWEEAKSHELLLILTSRGSFNIKVKEIDPIVPSVNSVFSNTSANIPDIAFLRIDPSCKLKLEARGKVFYSIDKRINKLESILKRIDGYWAIFGNPEKMLNVEARTAPTFIYGTGVNEIVKINGWDYLTVELNIPDNPSLPSNFGGVSGGGLWRTFYSTNEKKEKFIVENKFEDIILSGVNFFQLYEGGSKLIAHGPSSVYHELLKYL